MSKFDGKYDLSRLLNVTTALQDESLSNRAILGLLERSVGTDGFRKLLINGILRRYDQTKDFGFVNEIYESIWNTHHARKVSNRNISIPRRMRPIMSKIDGKNAGKALQIDLIVHNIFGFLDLNSLSKISQVNKQFAHDFNGFDDISEVKMSLICKLMFRENSNANDMDSNCRQKILMKVQNARRCWFDKTFIKECRPYYAPLDFSQFKRIESISFDDIGISNVSSTFRNVTKPFFEAKASRLKSLVLNPASFAWGEHTLSFGTSTLNSLSQNLESLTLDLAEDGLSRGVYFLSQLGQMPNLKKLDIQVSSSPKNDEQLKWFERSIAKYLGINQASGSSSSDNQVSRTESQLEDLRIQIFNSISNFADILDRFKNVDFCKLSHLKCEAYCTLRSNAAAQDFVDVMKMVDQTFVPFIERVHHLNEACFVENYASVRYSVGSAQASRFTHLDVGSCLKHKRFLKKSVSRKLNDAIKLAMGWYQKGFINANIHLQITNSAYLNGDYICNANWVEFIYEILKEKVNQDENSEQLYPFKDKFPTTQQHYQDHSFTNMQHDFNDRLSLLVEINFYYVKVDISIQQAESEA